MTEICIVELQGVKDRHQWLGRELQCAVSWSVYMLFYNALIYIVHHSVVKD